MNNGRINNTQRKVFATLAEEVLAKKIQQARDESGEVVAQITEQIKRDLGVDTINNQIQALEKQIKNLQDKKEALGFPQWNNHPIRKDSEAKKLIDSRTRAAVEKVRELEEKRTEVVAGIWASTMLDEAMNFLNEVRAL